MDYTWQIVRLMSFGFVFGLASVVPPGPINTQIARRTLKFGFLPGLAFGVGCLAIENGLALLACFGYGEQLGSYPALKPIMLFVGFIVLCVVGTFAVASGYRAWQHPDRSLHSIDTRGGDPALIRSSPALAKVQIISMPRSFLAGAGMAIISPYTIIFWLIALPSASHELMSDARMVWPLPMGVLLGTSLWIGGYTAMIAWLKRYKSTGMWADLVGGTLLLVFAGIALLQLVAMMRRSGSLELFR